MRDTGLLCECPICGEDTEIKVEFKDFLDYQFEKKPVVSQAFPYLTLWERNCLLFGLCQNCQNYSDNDEWDDDWEEDEDSWKYDGWPSEFDDWEEDEENESEDE